MDAPIRRARAIPRSKALLCFVCSALLCFEWLTQTIPTDMFMRLLGTSVHPTSPKYWVSTGGL